ncbi:MAG: hypothetical protein ACQKBY_01560, partial [Verrucomicrobiales bacterium]
MKKYLMMSLLAWPSISQTQAALIASYSFDAQNGDDSSGNGNHADTSVGGISYAAGGFQGTGYALQNAGDGYLQAATSTSLESTADNLTVSFWIKSTVADYGTNNWQRFIRKGEGVNGSWIINRNSNTDGVLSRTDTAPDG